MTNCAICRFNAPQNFPSSGDWLEQDCPKCGRFKITGSAAATEIEGEQALLKIRGYVLRNGSEKTPADLDTQKIKQIVESKVPTISERADLMLREVYDQTKYLGQRVSIITPRFLGITYSNSDYDLRFLADYLESEGLVISLKTLGSHELSLTPHGYAMIENYRNHEASIVGSAFVAMWFNEEVKDAWELGIKPAIQSCGYNPIRIDEVHHHEKIDDRILRTIRESDFVVADLTGHRGGVYFEAGFAIALGKPVIWTCRDDNFREAHFDVNHYHIISWGTEAELKNKLEDKLIALFGKQEPKVF